MVEHVNLGVAQAHCGNAELRLVTTVQGRGGPMTLVVVRDNMTGWTRGWPSKAVLYRGRKGAEAKRLGEREIRRK